MIINIRGNLGAQITSLIAGLAIAKETSQVVDKVIHNTHNYPKNLYILEPETINKTFITQATNFSGQVIQQQGTKKTDAFNIINTNVVLKHLDSIRPSLALPSENIPRSVLHIRDNDRPLATKEAYLSIMDSNIIMGDNIEYLKSFNSPIQHENALEDWLFIYNSKSCVGAFSAFTFSIALLNKNFSLNLLKKSSCKYSSNLSEKNWESLDLYVEALDNINWVT